MKHNENVCILLACFLLLVSCQAQLTEIEPEPTLDIITLAVQPELTHWLPKVAQCADALPNFAIITRITPQPEEVTSEADLVLRLGERTDEDPFVTVLGTEDLVVFGGQGVPVTVLSLESLQALFTGAVTHWDQLPEELSVASVLDETIQILSYPEGNALRSLFSETYLESQPIKDEAFIFSTNDALEALLDHHPTAIGYGLASNLTPGEKILAITGIDQNKTQQYVLAITENEPQNLLRQLLLCLQESQ